MATTIIPNIDHPRDLSVDIDALYETVKEWLLSSQGDCDKADDPENESFYAGQVTIAHGTLNLMQGKPADWSSSNGQ